MRDGLIVALARAINTALIILLRRQTRAWDTIGSAVYPSYEVYSQFERLPKRHRFTHLLHSSCRGRTLFLTRQQAAAAAASVKPPSASNQQLSKIHKPKLH